MLRYLRRHTDRDRIALAAGPLLPLAVAAVLLPARAHVSNTNVALVLVVVVVGVASLGNRIAGALAALSAAAWFDFFYTLPYDRFSISNGDDIRTAVLLLLVGLAVSQLAARARQLKVVTITDADHLDKLRETAELARSADSANLVVDRVLEQLVELLDLRSCRFEYGMLLGHPARLEHNGSVLVGNRPWPVGVLGLPEEEIELRAYAHGHYYGRFMMLPASGARPPLQARLVAATLGDETGAALANTESAHAG